MSAQPAIGEDLPVHRLRVELAPTTDKALPLQMVSLLHRRGVRLLELHYDSPLRNEAPGQFTVVFCGAPQSAHVVQAGFESMINVLQTRLEPHDAGHPSQATEIAQS